jgi:cell division protein ZapA
MEKKMKIVIKALPDLEIRSGVYVIKPNGEWDKYEYKDVLGKVDVEGKYRIVLAGREYQLINKLRIPQKEWKKFLYYNILNSDEIELMNKDLGQLTDRELTRLIKHRWLVYNEINNQEIEVRVDRDCIPEKIESNMLSLYTENEFWKRWFNRYFFKEKTRIKIKLPIYDTELEVSIDKIDIEKFDYAARLVTDRLNAYTVAYKDRKTEHQIALMSMLDLALLSIRKESNETK